MRISREVMFMDMTEVAARRSTCFRGNTGALIVQGNNVVSIGYNGPPAGHDHCAGHACEGASTGCVRSIHAEANAIMRAGILKVDGCDLYSTSAPCPHCAQMIKHYGLKRVFYRHRYRTDMGLDILTEAGIEVFRVMPNGQVIDVNGKLIDAQA